MKNNYPYLNDKDFLNTIYHLPISVYHAKVTALDWEENSLEEIQGKISNGNFTFDSNSNVRRTGSLSIVIQDDANYTNLQYLFAINKKVSVELGIKNTTDLYTQYSYIWFPFGIYVINNLSISHSTTDMTISLSLQDKMCLLNGQCGGVITSAVVFDTVDTYDSNGQWIVTRPTIVQIIQELVNHFGKEQLNKIIISDLSTSVKQVMKWTGSSPLYIIQKNQEIKVLTDITTYEQLITQGWLDIEGSPFQYGTDVGFIYTDFTYPGDLICEAGATVTTILDQIVEILGNYEYFYDVYGNFVFQQIKNYLNNAQTTYAIEELSETGDIAASSYLLDTSKGKAVWDFQNSSLITSFNNTPQYISIKNDFVIWGVRKTTTGAEYPIRYHLAIDKKPNIGNTYEAFVYTDPDDGIDKWHCPMKYETKENFPQTGVAGFFYYDSTAQKIYTWGQNNQGVLEYIEIDASLERVTTKDWRTQLYFQGVSGQPFGIESNYYYTELKNEWPKIYNILPDVQENGQWVNHSDFKPETLAAPMNIDFFLDFIDSTTQIGEFSVENISRRSYSISQTDLNCVIQPKIPDIILIDETKSNTEGTALYDIKELCESTGQTYCQVNDDIYDMLSPGGTYNSCYEYIRQLLHEYTSYNQSISVTCLPIYHLEPNTRVKIMNPTSRTSQDYMISTISFSLGVDAVMSIEAKKALERF